MRKETQGRLAETDRELMKLRWKMRQLEREVKRIQEITKYPIRVGGVG